MNLKVPAIILTVTGILALIIFFLIGLVILGFVRVRDGIRDVAEYEAKLGLS